MSSDWLGWTANWLQILTVVVALVSAGIGALLSRGLSGWAIFLIALTAGVLTIWGAVGFTRLLTPTARATESRDTSRATPIEIERTIKPWIDGFGLTSKRVLDDPTSNFHFIVTMLDVPLDLFNPKLHPELIVIQEKIDASALFAELKTKLSEGEQKEFVLGLREHMLSAGISYRNLEGDLTAIELQELILFAPSLTSLDFLKRLMAVQTASKMLSNALSWRWRGSLTDLLRDRDSDDNKSGAIYECVKGQCLRAQEFQ